MQKSYHRKLPFSLILIALGLLGWWQRMNIFDHVRLYNYQPSSQVVALADNTTMSPYGRNLFYVYHPELEDKDSFNLHCSTTGEQTIVLGCYINPRGIYLYNVTDERLNGVEEVTAAHEMLHAAYDRLSSKEKSRVNRLIESAYAGVTNSRIRDTINSYKEAGADTTNELHSILGTEVRGLPAELESYYKKYFTDRTKIVDYSEKYEAVFESSQQELKSLEKQIDNLKSKMDQDLSTIKAEEAAISDEGQRLESLRAQNRASEYNAGVNPYNARIQKAKSLVAAYNGEVNQYNSLVEQYKNLGNARQDLYKAVDSHASSI